MASATIRTDLELEYLFCPGSGQAVPDTSVNLFHGTMGFTSSVETRGAGVDGSDPDWVSNGVEFLSDPGTGSFDVVNAPAGQIVTHDTANVVTLETWINVTTGVGAFISFGWEILQLQTSFGGVAQFYCYSLKDAFGRVELELVNGATVLTPGIWYHVVGVRTLTDVEIYINGALDGTIPLDYPGANYALEYFNDARRTDDRFLGSGADVGGPFPDGAGETSLHNGHRGRMGEARVYSSALTAADVLFNYNASNYYPSGKNSCGIGPAARYYAM